MASVISARIPFGRKSPLAGLRALSWLDEGADERGELRSWRCVSRARTAPTTCERSTATRLYSPESLTGFTKRRYKFWHKEPEPHGYKLRAQIMDFPDGVPGDVGMFLKW
jgi:hypothetical protein